MAVYLQATLELNYETLPIFLNIAPTLKTSAEDAGWRMISALITKIGPVNTVIHLWELEDMNAFDVGIKAMAAHPEAGRIYSELCKTGVKETLIFADATPYCPEH